MSNFSIIESLKPVHQLASMRKRLTLLVGVTATIAATVLALLIAALVDTRFVLPLGVRWTILIGGIVFALAAVWFARLRSLAQSTKSAASAFEKAHPIVGQRIRTSVDMEGTPVGDSPDAKALRKQLGRETTRDLEKLPWAHLVPSRRFFLATGALAVVIGAFIFGLNSNPDLRLGLKRILSPSSGVTYTDISWDQLPTDFDERHPLRLSVTVSRRVSEPQVFLRDANVSEAEWEEVTLTALAESGQWDAILTDRRTDLEVYAIAGDARTTVKKLNYHPIPKLVSSRVKLTYPAYTGLPEEVLEQGDVRAVEETEVEWEFVFDHPPLKAEWHLGTEGKSDLSPEEGSGAYRVKGKLDVSKIKASLTVYAYDGEPLDAWRYQVTGVEDKMPVVKVLEPKDGVKATSITELPVRIRAMDDYGVSEIGVVLDAVGERDWILEEVVDASDQKRIDAVVQAMLEKVPVTIRDNVRLHAYALDHKARGGPRAVTPLISIEIVPFKQRWRWGGRQSGGAVGIPEAREKLLKLGEIIKQQRELVSQTFVIKETSRTATAVELKPLQSKETLLSARSIEIALEWKLEGELPLDDINLLEIAGFQMKEAAQHFQKLKVREAFVSADRALANLLQLKKELLKVIVKSEDPGQPIDPKEAPPALGDLSAEAERLAREEADVREQLKSENSKLNVLRRQQEVAVADTGELYARLIDHPEMTKGALVLMDDAEKSVRAAEDLVRTDEPKNAIPQLTDAENKLLDLAQFLRALELKLLSESLNELAEQAEQNSKDAEKAAEAEAKEEKQAGNEGENPGAESKGEKPGEGGGGESPGGGEGESPESKPGGEKTPEEMLADAARETELADKILESLAAKSKGEGDGESGEEGEGENEGNENGEAKTLEELRKELEADKLAGKLAELGEEAREGTLDKEGRDRTRNAARELKNLSKRLKGTVAQLNASKLAKLVEAREAAKAVEEAFAKKEGEKNGEGEGEKPGQGKGEGEKEGKGEGLAKKEGEGKGKGEGEKPGEGEGKGAGEGKKPGEGEGLAKKSGEGEGSGKGEGEKPGEGEGEVLAQNEGEGKGQGEGDGDSEGEGGQGVGGDAQGIGTPLERFADSLERSGQNSLRQWAPTVRNKPLDVSTLGYVKFIKEQIDRLISEMPTPATPEAAPIRIPEDRRREIEDYFKDLSDDFSDEGWSSLEE